MDDRLATLREERDVLAEGRAELEAMLVLLAVGRRRELLWPRIGELVDELAPGEFGDAAPEVERAPLSERRVEFVTRLWRERGLYAGVARDAETRWRGAKERLDWAARRITGESAVLLELRLREAASRLIIPERRDEAIDDLRALLDIDLGFEGRRNFRWSARALDLAKALRRRDRPGDLEEAARISADVWEWRRGLHGEEHPFTLVAFGARILDALAAAEAGRSGLPHWRGLDELAEAAAWLVETRERLFGNRGSPTALALSHLARVQILRNDRLKAEAAARRTIASMPDPPPRRERITAQIARVVLVEALVGRARSSASAEEAARLEAEVFRLADEAEPMLRHGLEGRRWLDRLNRAVGALPQRRRPLRPAADEPAT